MLDGIWTSMSRVLRRFFGLVSEAGADSAQGKDDLAQSIEVLQSRELSCEATELRHFHKVIGVDQRTALSTLKQLERSGVVTINHNLTDPFASTIHLNEKPQADTPGSTKRTA